MLENIQQYMEQYVLPELKSHWLIGRKEEYKGLLEAYKELEEKIHECNNRPYKIREDAPYVKQYYYDFEEKIDQFRMKFPEYNSGNVAEAFSSIKQEIYNDISVIDTLPVIDTNSRYDAPDKYEKAYGDLSLSGKLQYWDKLKEDEKEQDFYTRFFKTEEIKRLSGMLRGRLEDFKEQLGSEEGLKDALQEAIDAAGACHRSEELGVGNQFDVHKNFLEKLDVLREKTKAYIDDNKDSRKEKADEAKYVAAMDLFAALREDDLGTIERNSPVTELHALHKVVTEKEGALVGLKSYAVQMAQYRAERLNKLNAPREKKQVSLDEVIAVVNKQPEQNADSRTGNYQTIIAKFNGELEKNSKLFGDSKYMAAIRKNLDTFQKKLETGASTSAEFHAVLESCETYLKERQGERTFGNGERRKLAVENLLREMKEAGDKDGAAIREQDAPIDANRKPYRLEELGTSTNSNIKNKQQGSATQTANTKNNTTNTRRRR